MGEMGYILFPYYQYIADVIYMFLLYFCSNFQLKFDFSLVYDENFISKNSKRTLNIRNPFKSSRL